MSHKIRVLGYLGADATLAEPGDVPVVNFPVASNDYAGKKVGQVTTWFRVEAWGDRFRNLQPYLVKGSLVLVEGNLVSEGGNPPMYQDKDGNTRSSFRLRADSIELAGKPQEHGSDEREQPVEEDDMPF